MSDTNPRIELSESLLKTLAKNNKSANESVEHKVLDNGVGGVEGGGGGGGGVGEGRRSKMLSQNSEYLDLPMSSLSFVSEMTPYSQQTTRKVYQLQQQEPQVDDDRSWTLMATSIPKSYSDMFREKRASSRINSSSSRNKFTADDYENVNKFDVNKPYIRLTKNPRTAPLEVIKETSDVDIYNNHNGNYSKPNIIVVSNKRHLQDNQILIGNNTKNIERNSRINSSNNNDGSNKTRYVIIEDKPAQSNIKTFRIQRPKIPEKVQMANLKKHQDNGFNLFYDREADVMGLQCCTCWMFSCKAKCGRCGCCGNLISCPVYCWICLIFPIFILLAAAIIILSLYGAKVITG